MNGTVIIGAGGHAKIVIQILRSCHEPIVGLVDDRQELWGQSILGLPILGGLELLERDPNPVIIAIGSNRSRQKISQRFSHFEWKSAIHPSAIIDPTVQIGKGCTICAGVILQVDSTIGQHCIINTAASVDHDCRVSDFVHIGPGVHLAGEVILESGVFLGIGCQVIPKTHIGSWSTVGAGAVVTKNLDPEQTYVGIPARAIRNSLMP